MIDKNSIIETYKNKLFDDYYNYLIVIDELNKTIPSFAEELGLFLHEDISFDYPEFCKKFILSLRKNLKENKDLFNQHVIYHIFKQLIYDKINENIDKTSELYDDEDDEEFFIKNYDE